MSDREIKIKSLELALHYIGYGPTTLSISNEIYNYIMGDCYNAHNIKQ